MGPYTYFLIVTIFIVVSSSFAQNHNKHHKHSHNQHVLKHKVHHHIRNEWSQKHQNFLQLLQEIQNQRNENRNSHHSSPPLLRHHHEQQHSSYHHHNHPRVRKLTHAEASKYRHKYLELFTAPKTHKVHPVLEPNLMSNLTQIASKCHPRELYASFNPAHKSAVEDLLELYSDKKNLESLLEFSSFIKQRPEVHPNVWYASFLRAQAIHSPHHLGFDRPSPISLFPSTFFPDELMSSASAQISPAQRFKRQFEEPVTTAEPQNESPKQACIFVDERVGRDNGPENALWYFREDVLLNAHHFVWHMLYPTSSTRPIERRGELFYFFHHDLLGRYTAERLANNLPQDGRPSPLYIRPNTVIEEGFNAHLTDGISTESWAPRAPNQRLTTTSVSFNIYQMLQGISTSAQRIREIFNTGTFVVSGGLTRVGPEDDIDIFGELAEASTFSINPDYYGQPGMHNSAHWVIANIRNTNFPRGTIGVMGHSAAAIRDPVFFQVHRGIDEVFIAYKNRFLPPYALDSGEHQLIFKDIRINSVIVQSEDTGARENNLGTFWRLKTFNLEGGLDFNGLSNQRAVNRSICAKHLDHEEFTYTLQVENERGAEAHAMVRIFMAPRFKSLEEHYTFNEQRHLFFKMDSFVQQLNPGANTIIRQSIDSTLTAPWPRSIQEIREDIRNGARTNVHCECGYPHHLLLPRGTEDGMDFDLFVMITDASIDAPPESLNSSNIEDEGKRCYPSHIHCGLYGQHYPDAKPLGYPFDRRPFLINENHSPSTIEEYASYIHNAAVGRVRITHYNVQL